MDTLKIAQILADMRVTNSSAPYEVVCGWADGIAAAVVQNDVCLRDYFAAKAMQVHCHELGPANLPPDEWHREVARVAYMTADAMLKARGETP